MSLSRLALRRLLTIEVAVNVILGSGTLACVLMTVWLAAIVWRIPA